MKNIIIFTIALYRFIFVMSFMTVSLLPLLINLTLVETLVGITSVLIVIFTINVFLESKFITWLQLSESRDKEHSQLCKKSHCFLRFDY